MNLRLYVESVKTVPKLIHFSLEGIIFCSLDHLFSRPVPLYDRRIGRGAAWYGKEMSAVAVVFFLNCVPKLCFTISLAFMQPLSRKLAQF